MLVGVHDFKNINNNNKKDIRSQNRKEKSKNQIS